MKIMSQGPKMYSFHFSSFLFYFGMKYDAHFFTDECLREASWRLSMLKSFLCPALETREIFRVRSHMTVDQFSLVPDPSQTPLVLKRHFDIWTHWQHLHQAQEQCSWAVCLKWIVCVGHTSVALDWWVFPSWPSLDTSHSIPLDRCCSETVSAHWINSAYFCCCFSFNRFHYSGLFCTVTWFYLNDFIPKKL